MNKSAQNLLFAGVLMLPNLELHAASDRDKAPAKTAITPSNEAKQELKESDATTIRTSAESRSKESDEKAKQSDSKAHRTHDAKATSK